MEPYLQLHHLISKIYKLAEFYKTNKSTPVMLNIKTLTNQVLKTALDLKEVKEANKTDPNLKLFDKLISETKNPEHKKLLKDLDGKLIMFLANANHVSKINFNYFKYRKLGIENYLILPNKGGGLCLFYTVQQIFNLLYKKSITIDKLKETVIEYLREHPDNWKKIKKSIENNMKLNKDYSKYVVQQEQKMLVEKLDSLERFEKYIKSRYFFADDDIYNLFSDKFNFGYIIIENNSMLYHFPKTSSYFILFRYTPGHWELIVKNKGQLSYRYDSLKKDLGDRMFDFLNKLSEVYDCPGLEKLIEINQE